MSLRVLNKTGRRHVADVAETTDNLADTFVDTVEPDMTW